jgi:hypothetical protein
MFEATFAEKGRTPTKDTELKKEKAAVVEKETFMDAQRSQNINIAINHLRLSHADIRSAHVPLSASAFRCLLPASCLHPVCP